MPSPRFARELHSTRYSARASVSRTGPPSHDDDPLCEMLAAFGAHHDDMVFTVLEKQ